MNDVIKTQIFLVTKNKCEENEYSELCDFVDAVNQKFQKSYHLKTDLISADNFDTPEWKNKEYRKQMRESEAVFFLIFMNPDEIIHHDFLKVLDDFKEEGKPAVYTYFYKAEDKDRSPDVLSFMSKLDKEIGKFYSVYEHMDAVKLRILIQLKLNELDMAEMSFEKGKSTIDGSEATSPGNVKTAADNSSLKDWYNEAEKTEKDYFPMKAFYAKNKSDENLCRGYAELVSERSNILDKTEKTEKMLSEKSMNLIKDSDCGEMTARQREAYRLLEEGDPEGAYAVLDFDEMTSEYHRKMETRSQETQIRKQEDKKITSIYIRELRNKIDIAESMASCKNHINDITECYEEIMSASLEYGVEYDSVLQYAKFLDVYVSGSKAYEVIKTLEEVYDNEHTDESEKAEFYNTAGHITHHIPGKQNEAEEYYVKAAAVREKLAEKNPDRYGPDLACSYNCIGNFYYNQGQRKKAEEFYLKAADIREKLAERNPDRYGPDLADSYNNAGIFYDDQGQSKKAEEFYLKAADTEEKLAEKNPDRYEPGLAGTYNNAGAFYNDHGQSRKAQEFYSKAADIREKLAKKNPDQHESDAGREL